MDDVKAATSSAIESITSLCKLTVVNKLTQNATSSNNNTTNNSTHSEGGQPGGAEGTFVIPDILTKNLCPGDCSGNGRCVNSTCICYSNFTASDCSIGKGKKVIQCLAIPLSSRAF